MNIKIGIIGIGSMGSAHAVQIFQGKIPGLVLTAVCELVPARRSWAEENLPGVTVYQQTEDLCRHPNLDAVLIATPHKLHPPMAIQAFAHGLHVLTEKPAAVCAEDVVRMEEAAEQAGKLFAVMLNQRTDPLFQKAREILESGRLGLPKRLVWNVTNWYRSQAYYNSGGWRATWKGEGGGILMNQAPHNLDLWQWLFGMPDRIRAFLSYGKYHDIEVEDDAVIYGEYASGATAVFITSTGEYPGTNRLEITGDRGKMVLEDGILKLHTMEGSERKHCYTTSEAYPAWPLQIEQYQISQEMDGHLAILKNFTQSILGKESLIAKGIEGLYSLSIANAAYLSHWQDQWITLPLKEPFRPYLEEREGTSMERRTECEGDVAAVETEYNKRWQVNW